MVRLAMPHGRGGHLGGSAWQGTGTPASCSSLLQEYEGGSWAAAGGHRRTWGHRARTRPLSDQRLWRCAGVAPLFPRVTAAGLLHLGPGPPLGFLGVTPTNSIRLVLALCCSRGPTCDTPDHPRQADTPPQPRAVCEPSAGHRADPTEGSMGEGGSLPARIAQKKQP